MSKYKRLVLYGVSINEQKVPKMPDFSDFPEAYEVTKTIELVGERDFDGSGGPTELRIEVLRCLHSGKFHIRYLQRTYFHLQPYYPQSMGKFDQDAADYSLWVPMTNMPSVEEITEDKAIVRALEWLKERGALEG